ncbi:MAG: SDR family oxidoreductase [Candidatus Dormibacteria bacterium]
MSGTAVVVTGASTGIGRATALHLDSLGLHVFAGVRRKEHGDQLKSDSSGQLTPIKLDVTRPADVDSAALLVREYVRDSRLAGIVNNAGIAVAGPVEFVPLDKWRYQLDVNVIGAVAMVQAFAPMLREGRGRIVSVGSLGGRLAQPMAAPYCASKFALEAISDALRVEMKPWGVEVALIEPGAVKTPIWAKGMRAGEELLRNAPPELRQLYGAAVEIASARAAHEDETGVEPLVVAKAIAHALLAPRPRTRYAVGRQARTLIPLTRLLPDRLKDALILRAGGLPRRPEDTAARGDLGASQPVRA